VILAEFAPVPNAPSESAAASSSVTPEARPAPQTGVPTPVPTPEIGGPTGPEPTRYGDWEKKGRCIDF
jgi:hypothetical protein